MFYYYKIRSYVDEAVKHIGLLIPIFNDYEYTSINYDGARNLKLEDFIDTQFNKEIALLLCNINMSSYNLFGEFSPCLSESINYIQHIQNTGYIYELKSNMKSRKQIVIFSFRGTKTTDDVFTDLDSVQTEMSGYSNNVLVHRGFYRSWLSYRDEIKNYIKTKCDKNTIFLITGHSLGCASALFTALTVAINHSNVKLYMFAPPRIGNHHFISRLNKEVPDNYAIINIPDFVPTLPPVTLGITGSTWLYENFPNRYILDYQMGSNELNHRLDTYSCGLSENQGFCKEPIWKKVPILVNL
jgi:predicted lipase